MNYRIIVCINILLTCSFEGQTVFASTQANTVQLRSSLNHAIEKIQERNPELIIQLGGSFASYGKAQLLEIEGSNGNWYTKNGSAVGSFVPGIGFYVDGWSHENYQVKFGMDWLYLLKTSVSGYIQQEQAFTNLSYKYKVRNAPLFFASKVKLNNANNNRYSWIFDAGIGPNFMRTSNYNEYPLTPYTIPYSSAFSGNSNVTFSAMVGLGLRLNHLLKNLPVECGYRFLYLGKGDLNVVNNSSINSISTGQTYANAILCGIVFS